MRFLINLSLVLLFVIACKSRSGQENATFPYDLSEAEDKQKLKGKLDEISGLSAIDNQRIACVQDEKGNIYIYNLNTEEIERKIDFAKSGDYEGIALVDSTAFVVRSDGVLFEVKHFGRDDQETIEHKTSLSAKCNVEGITYDENGSRLLLACKGEPVVYAFDLRKMELVEKPAFHVRTKQLDFESSGIALHPITGQLYVISAEAKMLLVLSSDGEIENMMVLEKGFKQPEGITFISNGDMVISNEAVDGKANIQVFKYDPK